MRKKWVILSTAGLLLTLFTLGKYCIESIGTIRANTFGWIQAAMLICGLLIIAIALVFYPYARQNNFRQLSIYLLTLFSILITIRLPGLCAEAKAADLMYDGTIATIGDDIDYQILAVNMLNGKGYSPSVTLPLEDYHLDLTSNWGKQLRELYQDNDPILRYESDRFVRPPALPLLLTSVYALFGSQSLTARLMMAVLVWLTALLLLWMGFSLAGWLGALAGGVAGLYHVFYYPGIYNFEFVLTEIPAAFWLTLFCLLFTHYLTKGRLSNLYLSGLILACLVLTRPNMLIAFPFILLYLYCKKNKNKPILLFTTCFAIPLIIWSLYGSISLGKTVAVTTQGGKIFPQFNNIDVLEGIGPDHSGQGAWQIGAVYDESGKLIENRHEVKPGENGWVKGFQFWLNNFEELPRLFYVKLRRGFFYDNSWSINIMHPEGIYLTGVAYLLLAAGLRLPARKPCILKKYDSKQILLLQLMFVSLIMLLWNQVAFWLTAILWIFISLLSIMRPYGDAYRLPFQSPTWFLSFIFCHAVITLLFAGYRFHWPLDVQIIFYCLLGVFLTVYELLKRNIISAVPFLLVIFTTLWLHYM